MLSLSMCINGRLRSYLMQGMGYAEAYDQTLRTTGAGVILTALT